MRLHHRDIENLEKVVLHHTSEVPSHLTARYRAGTTDQLAINCALQLFLF